MNHIYAREFVEKESVLSLIHEKFRRFLIHLTVFDLKWMFWAKKLVMCVPVWLTASLGSILSCFCLFVVIYSIRKLPLQLQFFGKVVNVLTVFTHFLKHLIVFLLNHCGVGCSLVCCTIPSSETAWSNALNVRQDTWADSPRWTRRDQVRVLWCLSVSI